MTRRQLLAIGLGADAIDYRVEIGRLFRVHPGIYAVGRPPVTPHEQAMAAVLACGPGAALSHGSALTLWGIWKRWERPFHVIVAGDRRPKGVAVHRNRLHRRDITRHYGIPVTTLARALLDQAPRMSAKPLTRAVNDGRLSRHLSVDGLARLLHAYPNHCGSTRLKAVLDAASERPTRSSFEDAFPAFCRRYGLPKPELNATVCGYEVDALFSEHKVIVELDGWEFHSSRASFEGDRNKDADTAAAGFLTYRLTWQRFNRARTREADRLHAVLDQRRPA